MISCWKNVLVDKSTAIQSAIELLEQYPIQIILVVDEQNKILGSLTDGDIRRAFLKHMSLCSPVSLIMNTKFINKIVLFYDKI